MTTARGNSPSGAAPRPHVCVYENGNEIIALATPKEEAQKPRWNLPPEVFRFSTSGCSLQS